MTIERLHFKDGVHLPLEELAHKELLKIIRENSDKIVTLPEGEYDLTPSWWKKHLCNHNLIVLGNGTGVYRAIAREKGVGTKEVSMGKIGEVQKGGRVIKIPEEQFMVIVGGPLKDRERMGVYEIIFYSPPRKSSKSP